MTRELDTVSIEIRLLQIKGLAGALDMMACADNLQKPEQEALAAMSDAFEDVFNALWALLNDGGTYDDAPEGQP